MLYLSMEFKKTDYYSLCLAIYSLLILPANHNLNIGAVQFYHDMMKIEKIEITTNGLLKLDKSVILDNIFI